MPSAADGKGLCRPPFMPLPSAVADGKIADSCSGKRTSESEDEDYVATKEEVSSKKKVLKKEYGTSAASKPGLNKKAPARKIPMSKSRKVATGETMKFTIESDDGEAAGDDQKKKRAFYQPATAF